MWRQFFPRVFHPARLALGVVAAKPPLVGADLDERVLALMLAALDAAHAAMATDENYPRMAIEFFDCVRLRPDLEQLLSGEGEQLLSGVALLDFGLCDLRDVGVAAELVVLHCALRLRGDQASEDRNGRLDQRADEVIALSQRWRRALDVQDEMSA